MAAVSSSGALAYTLSKAEEASRAAIEALSRVPDSPYKDCLVQLAEFAVERQY
jgi:octaprenyl-diphosphate synthase